MLLFVRHHLRGVHRRRGRVRRDLARLLRQRRERERRRRRSDRRMMTVIFPGCDQEVRRGFGPGDVIGAWRGIVHRGRRRDIRSHVEDSSPVVMPLVYRKGDRVVVRRRRHAALVRGGRLVALGRPVPGRFLRLATPAVVHWIARGFKLLVAHESSRLPRGSTDRTGRTPHW